MHKNGCRVSVYLSRNARFVCSVLSMRASRKKKHVEKKAHALHFHVFFKKTKAKKTFTSLAIPQAHARFKVANGVG